MVACQDDGGVIEFPSRGSALSGDKSFMTKEFIRNFGDTWTWHGTSFVWPAREVLASSGY
jgi:hypothetical protein